MNFANNIVEHPAARKKKYPGHDVILMSLIKKRALVELCLMSGDRPVGFITQMDKWSITIRDENTDKPHTYFKHGIESFGEIEGE